MRTSAVPAIVGLICFWASAEILAQTPGEQLPAYIQLRRDVLVNSDLWSNQPEILAANLGFEGIIGIPGLRSADDLPLAAAAGAGVNLDWAQFAPVPPLRNLTTGAGPLGVELGGFGNSPILGDAMPIEVSWPLLPSSVQPDNIAITLNTGDVVTPVAAALNPNYDYNERHVIVTFGEFANRQTPGSAGAIYPVAVSFVDGSSSLMAVGPHGPVSLTGLTIGSSSPYVSGPGLVGARLTPFSPVGDFAPPALAGASPNDGFSLYGDDAEYRLRLFTSGGFSPDGVSGFLATDFEKFFRLHAVDASGQSVTIDKTGQVYDLGAGTVQVIGLAEVGPPTTGEPDRTYDAEDHDNYFDIILKGDQAAIRLLQSVEIPTSTEPGYSDIYNPGGPGRTPIPGVIYTEPAAPQTFAINQALDESGTVSYASQDFANYDLDDDLPVVFWLNDSSGPGRLTASSNETNSLLAAGLTLKSIPFANEAARPGVSDIDAFFNSVTGDRIYTLDAVESLQLASSDAWQHIGRVFGAFDRSWPGAEPVYRFLDSTTGWHVFSPNLNDALQAEGIEYQGIGWYAASFVPVPQEVRFDRSDELLVTDALASGGMLSINGSGMLRLEAGGSFTQGIIIRDGRLQVNGSLSGGPLTVERDGVLSGKGVISNEVTVSGRLAPGQSPGTMTFLSSVDMAVDGVLEIEVDGPLPVDGPGGYDRVIVVGAENHFGTAGILDVRLRDISPPATNSFTPHVGQRIRGVITSNGSVTGSFASLSQPTDGLLPGTRLDTLYHTASVDLVVTPQSYGDLAALGMTQTVNQAAVGSALDTIRPVAGVRPSGAAAELFPALAPLGADQIAPALDSLAGQIHADVLDAALAGQRLLQSVVVTRMAGFNLDSAVNKSGHIGWMQALGRRVDQRTSDGVSGYKALSQGAAVGIDGSPVPGTSLGVSFGELASEVTSGSDRTDINAIFAAAYGVHHFDNIRLSSHLLGSFDEYQSYRAVQIGTLNSIPSGNSDGWSFNTGTSVGRVMRLSDVCTIEPVTSMTYFRVKRNAFQESTGDSEALSVFDSSRASLRSRIGATLAYVRPRLAGTASLGWNHEFLDKAALISSSLSGSAFPVRAASPGRNFFDLDLGLSGELIPGISLAGNYMLTTGQSFATHGGLVRLALQW